MDQPSCPPARPLLASRCTSARRREARKAEARKAEAGETCCSRDSPDDVSMGVSHELVVRHHLSGLVLDESSNEASIMLSLLDDTQRQPTRAVSAQHVAQSVDRRRHRGLVCWQEPQRRGLDALEAGPPEGLLQEVGGRVLPEPEDERGAVFEEEDAAGVE